MDHVFGYGSLVRLDGSPARMRGHRRTWGVAMDNARTIPGYKYYVDARTGERPDVFVAFVDFEPANDGDAVDGVIFPVTAEELDALDARERNYERVSVTSLVEPRPDGGRVWAYAGRADARDRCARGRAEGRLVVSAEYARLVTRASGDEPPCPVVELRRIDL